MPTTITLPSTEMDFEKDKRDLDLAPDGFPRRLNCVTFPQAAAERRRKSRNSAAASAESNPREKEETTTSNRRRTPAVVVNNGPSLVVEGSVSRGEVTLDGSSSNDFCSFSSEGEEGDSVDAESEEFRVAHDPDELQEWWIQAGRSQFNSLERVSLYRRWMTPALDNFNVGSLVSAIDDNSAASGWWRPSVIRAVNDDGTYSIAYLECRNDKWYLLDLLDTRNRNSKTG
jgi:hypothetical protein